jgi:hypothetical protein
MPKITIDIPDGWFRKQTIPQLLIKREQFYKEMAPCDCTCDYCPDVTRCDLAYDRYNICGDCLLSK